MTKTLFVFQVIAAWTYALFQSIQVFSGHTGGLTLALWLMFITYLIFSLTLSVSSYKQQPSAERRWVISIFVQFLIIFVWLFIIGLKSIRWTNGDTIVIIIVMFASLITVYHYKGVQDPIGRGFLTVWCKGIPQLWIAYVMIACQSSEGIPPIAMLASHITSTPRLIQVYINGKNGGWDRSTIGLMMGESANVFTWYIATAVWLWMR